MDRKQIEAWVNANYALNGDGGIPVLQDKVSTIEKFLASHQPLLVSQELHLMIMNARETLKDHNCNFTAQNLAVAFDKAKEQELSIAFEVIEKYRKEHDLSDSIHVIKFFASKNDHIK